MQQVESMQSHRRTCWVCGASLIEHDDRWAHKASLDKLSRVSVGAGLEVLAHDSCLQSLQEEVDSQETRKATRQYNQDKQEIGRLLGTEAGKDVVRTQARAVKAVIEEEWQHRWDEDRLQWDSERMHK